jgi:hypothetical protein
MWKQWKGIALLMLISSSTAAQQTAAPIGLELGKATCSEASRRLKVGAGDGISVWSGGPILRIPANAPSIELDGLVSGLIVCDAQDRVIFVSLTLSKGGMAREGATSTARQLDSKYRAAQRNLPPVGDGYAEWKAANGTVEIDSPHLSFEFDVRYWAPGAKVMYQKWQATERRQREQKKAGNL